jgi:hypothetical protein
MEVRPASESLHIQIFVSVDIDDAAVDGKPSECLASLMRIEAY